MIYFGEENSTNDPEDSADTIRHYQSSRRHFEEKKSRSSSFISSIDDEQKPLFSGIVDSSPGIGKASGLDFEETVPTSGRMHIDKRSHSCKGNSELDIRWSLFSANYKMVTFYKLRTVLTHVNRIVFNFMKCSRSVQISDHLWSVCTILKQAVIIPKHL